MYCCSLCEYETSVKGNLVKHLKRQISCKETIDESERRTQLDELTKRELNEETYNCAFCDKEFNHQPTRSRHQKSCKKNPTNVTGPSSDELLKKITALEKTVEKLQNQASTSNVTNNITNNNINNINITNNIQINALGNEDIAYMDATSPAFQRELCKYITDKTNGLCDYMVEKHFNEQHPSNQNIRKLVKRDPFIETYNGKEWQPSLSNAVLDKVFEKIRHDFDNFLDRAFTRNRDRGNINRNLIDSFMRQVGEALDFSISLPFHHYEYNPDKEQTERQKIKRKKEIYKLACEVIYQKSKPEENQL